MLKSFLSAAMLLVLPVSGQAQAPKPFCKVNGVPVSGDGAYFLVRELKHEELPVSVSSLGSSLVDTEVLRQVAVRSGLDKTPEARKAIAEREESSLAAVCRSEIQEKTPAVTQGELDGAWAWAKAHALTQYELYRGYADTLEEARTKRQEWQEGESSGKLYFNLAKPFWVIADDEDLAPAEREIVRKLGGLGRTVFSEPYAVNGGRYAFLQCTGRIRKADPLLRHDLDDYAYGGAQTDGKVSFPKEFMPALHLRKVLEQLRAAAQLPPYPASGGPWPVSSREREEAADQRLLAAEARRMRLDKQDWVVTGLAVVRARA
ncbi:MAG TPA: hypothetical protein VN436_07255, partial [Holophaga sp.]|nr:hypothetical protein [Holophaga sp.]